MTASDHALELATVAARAASGKLASDVVALDVSDQLVITDVFLLASAPNDRQVRRSSTRSRRPCSRIRAKPIRREGESEGRWVLLDFGDLVVHVQHADEREYYSLERLWRDCPVIELPPEARGRPKGSEDGGSYTDGTDTGGAAAWYRAGDLEGGSSSEAS